MSFTILGTLTTPETLNTPESAKTLDMTITGATAMIKNQQYVDYLNQQSECGGAWELNKEKAIIAELCGDSDLADILAPRFDIYKVDASNLYTGNLGSSGTDTDGSSAEKRPKEFDSSSYYTKKM